MTQIIRCQVPVQEGVPEVFYQLTRPLVSQLTGTRMPWR